MDNLKELSLQGLCKARDAFCTLHELGVWNDEMEAMRIMIEVEINLCCEKEK